MATLLERLAQRITAEEAEIARIKADALADVKRAQERLTILRAAHDRLVAQPELETLIGQLAQVGITVTGG